MEFVYQLIIIFIFLVDYLVLVPSSSSPFFTQWASCLFICFFLLYLWAIWKTSKNWEQILPIL